MTLVQAVVVGSVILMNRRQSTELSPQKLRNLWTEWQLRALILLSLTSQIILVILGNRRKYIAKTWIRAIVWFFYLLADNVATVAIGVLFNNIGEVYWEVNRNSRSLEYELKAFWAPFLLLHLGGMDTITAYSLEDNELWLRHSCSIVTQALATMFILFMSWSIMSRLSPLFIVVFFLGLNKYCERVWALFTASEKRFRDLIPELMINENSRIMKECKLKQLQGYHVTTHQVLEVDVQVVDDRIPESHDAKEILLANGFFEMVKRLFADLILGFQDRDASRAIFESNAMNPEKALKVVEIELGLMYDVMYTKATVVYSAWGVTQRIIGSFLILGVLVMVSLDKALVGKNSSKIDLTITLLLLVVAWLLDFCAFGELLLSDQTAHWLIKRRKYAILETINHIRTMIPTNWGRKRKRWSKTVEQFSLLRFCFATRRIPLFCRKILKLLHIEEVAEIFWYQSNTPPDPLYLGLDEDLPKQIFKQVKDVMSWGRNNNKGTDLKSLYGRRGGLALEMYNRKDLQWSVDMAFEQLASQLGKYEQEQGKHDNQERTWNVIVFFWMEILGYAASQCKGRQHAQQLRRGGEYLTHLWLLMAHFGLTDHFQIPQSRAIAEAVLR
ncbi:uncharacterized protein LOC131303450 [Rhododendron vialii]|uniref:uncharacterized protein LOC131303450 n=1 Tax=Rhododendron vialii TaxID=182163 RepID=UPI0026605BD6|nr:uncharacterized protein LOC131303450 [Rhododendron vialii]